MFNERSYAKGREEGSFLYERYPNTNTLRNPRLWGNAADFWRGVPGHSGAPKIGEKSYPFQKSISWPIRLQVAEGKANMAEKEVAKKTESFQWEIYDTLNLKIFHCQHSSCVCLGRSPGHNRTLTVNQGQTSHKATVKTVNNLLITFQSYYWG